VKKNYKLIALANSSRETYHDKLELSGSEISFNKLPAGISVPFVHAHNMNEEVYIILEGKGQVFIDGEEIGIEKGNILRIDPVGQRCFKAADNSDLEFICIQTKVNSLIQFTETDAVISNTLKASWMK